MDDNITNPVKSEVVADDNVLSKKGLSNPVLIILTSLITALVVFSGFYFYHTGVVKEKDSKIRELTTNYKEVKTEIEKLNCDGVWDDKTGCAPSQLILISPNGGEEYCIGDIIPIRWKGPKDLEAVSIWLSTPNTGSANLGEYLAINEVEDDIGYGELDWDGTNVIGEPIAARDFYKVDIRTKYRDEDLRDTSDAIFSLKNCE